MLKNGQAYFKNFAVLTPQDFWSILDLFEIMHGRVKDFFINSGIAFHFIKSNKESFVFAQYLKPPSCHHHVTSFLSKEPFWFSAHWY